MLQAQLVSLREEDIDAVADILFSPTPASRTRLPSMPGHRMMECPDFYVAPDGKRKRRQRACKVCSLLKRNRGTDRRAPAAKRVATTLFCDACSEGTRRLYLCSHTRHPEYGDGATCFQIWHDRWKCGLALPPLVNNKIQMRKPGRTRNRRQILADEDEDEGTETSV